MSVLQWMGFYNAPEPQKEAPQEIKELPDGDDAELIVVETENPLEAKLKTTLRQLENTAKLHRQEMETSKRLEAQIQAADQEVKQREAKFYDEIASLKEELRKAFEQAQESLKETQKLLNDASELRRNQQEAEQTCIGLQSQNGMLQEQLKSKVEELALREKETAELRSKLSEQEREVSSLKAAKAAQTEALNNAKSLEAVQHQQNMVELAQLKQKENDLLAENQALTAEVLKLRLEASAKAEEQNKLAVRMNDLENQKTKLMTARDEDKRELKRAQEMSAQLSAQLQGLQDSLQAQGLDVTRLTQEGDRQKAEIKRLNNELCSLEEKLKAKALQEKAAEEEAQDLRIELILAREELGRLQGGNKQEVAAPVSAKEPTSSNDASSTTARSQSEGARILLENPHCVPIQCIRAADCDNTYPLLENKRFAVPKGLGLSHFNEHIRLKLKLNPNAPLSVYVDSSVALPNSELLEDLYAVCKLEDGFLHLKYSHISEEAP